MQYLKKRNGNLKGGPSKGAANPGAGPNATGGPYRTANYVKPDGPTQPTDRSLGMPRIKTRVTQKGV